VSQAFRLPELKLFGIIDWIAGDMANGETPCPGTAPL
jgi:hypothetical protein